MRLGLKLSEQYGVVAALDPQTINNTTGSTDVVDLKDKERVMFILNTGATDTTVDFAIRQSNNSNGTSDVALSGASITQYGATDDNHIKIIEVDAMAVKAAGYRYIFGKVTVGSGSTGALVAVIAIAANRYSPATDYDLTRVSEVVVKA